MHIYIYLYLFILLQAKINMYIIDHYVCVQVGIICEFVYYVPHVRVYIYIYAHMGCVQCTCSSISLFLLFCLPIPSHGLRK